MLDLMHSKLLLAIIVVLGFAAATASAAPIVTFDYSDLGGGLYRYDLTVDNSGGPEPFSGLNVLNANTVFGLDPGSTIGAPAGWDSFAPLPPFVDELNWFSLDPSDDIDVDDELAGFSFESTTAPWTLGYHFAVEAIGGTSSSQIPLADAVLVPEPSTALLLGAAIAALAAARKRETS
jgi:hypothetical protein